MKEIIITKNHSIDDELYDFEVYSFEDKELFVAKNESGAILTKFIFDCCGIEFDFNDYYKYTQNTCTSNLDYTILDYTQDILSKNIVVKIVEKYDLVFYYKVNNEFIELNHEHKTLITNQFDHFNIFKFVCQCIRHYFPSHLFNSDIKNLYDDFRTNFLSDEAEILTYISKFFENKIFDNWTFEVKFKKQINYDNY